MKIEIAPEEYYIRCTYEDALLYCFQLEIDGKTGWRLPNYSESSVEFTCAWYQNDRAFNSVETGKKFYAIPVRDILYD